MDIAFHETLDSQKTLRAAGSGVDRGRALRKSERFLLWSIRQWRSDWERWEKDADTAGHSPLYTQFAAAGLAEALPPFADAMEAVQFSARRALDVRAPACPSLSRDEERLLTLCRLSQAGCEALVMASLAVIMMPGNRRVASLRLAMATAALAEAGLRLPEPALKMRPRLH